MSRSSPFLLRDGRSRIAWLIVLFVLAALAFWLSYKPDRERYPEPSYAGPEVQPRMVSGSPTLGSDELATIAVFEQASQSVVFIVNRALRRDFFSLNPVEVLQGAGSGFIWDQLGHVVTNFHVVYGATSLTAVLSEKNEYETRLVGVAPDQDLAVLRIQAPNDTLHPISIGSAHDLRVGQKVLAIGNPFGLDRTLTTGVISAIGRTIKAMTGRTIEGVIQTDAAINPGNSGGPLLDSAGRLIGVNTQIVSPSGAFAGIGFAVPVDTVNRIVPQLIKYGKIIRPSIGISVLPVAITARWGVQGVVVREVTPEGGCGACRTDRPSLRQRRTSRAGRCRHRTWR